MATIDHVTVIDMLLISQLMYDMNIPTSNYNKSILNTSSLSLHDRILTFITDEQTDVQCGITINDRDQRICAAFRGSNSLTDWYYNLMRGKKQIKNDIYAHNGFIKQLFTTSIYNRMSTNIITLLKQYPTYKLYITGHSSGGALSTLFGYFLSNEIPDIPINIVTFASPRVGNYAFKCDFMSRPNIIYNRIKNKYDIFTSVPLLRYYHVGHLIYIKRTKCNWIFCMNIRNHRVSNYYLSLLDTVW